MTRISQQGIPLQPNDLNGSFTTVGSYSAGDVQLQYVRNQNGGVFKTVRVPNAVTFGCALVSGMLVACNYDNSVLPVHPVLIDANTSLVKRHLLIEGLSMVAYGANTKKDVVGIITDPSGNPDSPYLVSGFRVKGATPTVVERFTAPCGGETQMFDVNDLGVMVGSCDIEGPDGSVSFFSYVTADGVNWTPIAVPGASWTTAYRINKVGTIVGWYGLPDGSEHGFWATPVPVM
jgi:hypothetical protein